MTPLEATLALAAAWLIGFYCRHEHDAGKLTRIETERDSALEKLEGAEAALEDMLEANVGLTEELDSYRREDMRRSNAEWRARLN
ncbi:MAG TPA: hypothetical protein VFR23_25115 [Jiangellaceae bacterium]|nr:hypothetical protein [Jiangellaceae bacterium]